MSAAAIHQKFVHLADIAPRPSYLTTWEKHRHRRAHWLVEMIAEATGVFMYIFAGVGPNLIWVIGTLGKEEGVGSLFTVGVGYALGIVFAIAVCGSTSGGHFSPSVTISFVLFKGFPPLKALRYIIAQIIGGYIAFLLIYVQYKDLIGTVSTALKAAGPGVYETVMFSPQGPAGAFALYVAKGSNLARVFLNEFVCDFFLGLVIFAALDPTNFFLPPFLGPIVIAGAYSAVIWGYAPVGLAANAARDVSGRLAAVTIWGTSASGGTYAALAALTNIPATILAALFYEFFLTDSSRVVDPAHRQFMEGHQAHMEHRDTRYDNAVSDSDTKSTEKEDLPHHNRV